MKEMIGESFSSVGSGALIFALMIFLGSYGIIISEKIHRTIVAIFGGALMIIVGIIFNFYNQEDAIASVDFNTIGLLIGMMIIVNVIKDTGFFQYVAIKLAKIAKGNPWKIMLFFAIITAVFSAFLDNVTTIILMVPMVFVICDNLRIDPIPFLFVEIFMGNIGGAATLIGDPPNILIGSAAGFSFMDFLVNVGPIILIISLLILPFFKLLYGKRIKAEKEDMDRIMLLDENDSIENIKLLKRSLFILFLVILGFFFHGMLHIEGATIAILGAGLILIIDRDNTERVLAEIEWTTIFFFIGLFVLVGGLEHIGIISMLAEKIISLTNGNLQLTSVVMLWMSAIFSTFIDNIPFVATAIPMVQNMGATFPDLSPIWWSISLGACLGGNGTLIGASANLVVAGMSEKSGYKIKFVDFMKTGLVIMLVTVAISNVYIVFRYF